jgi:hypothetical protein
VSREARSRPDLRTAPLVFAACVLLTACAPQSASPSSSLSSPTSSPAPSPTPGSADLVAVAKVIFPYFPQYNYYSVCGANGDLSQCPVTDRLKTRLTQSNLTLCRCNNPSLSLGVTATLTQTGGAAHVVLGDEPLAAKMDLVIVQTGGKLLVDDEVCTGRDASTSIYVTTAPC